ncbi:LysR family transcriptional regulator [Noviherbaspirillum saxi]|uniref:LysR family transcriptional regulator n=1 Tax=Noviherbaspirillum saxi TaxID=2320863 RepID=A0A3A3FPN2_9BURK|nr:LysR family transcriptional regulator [Noviherbaspirillum saxi]RJF97420.1 LysR family transcriptional regulator [Noviherbaspirillum saxi]
MDLFQAMKVFAKVAEAGSLSGAARALDMSNPSVTRHIAELEAYLNARLFNRTTRRLSLTETGSNYLERCRQLLQDLDDATLAAGSSAVKPGGTLRISAPVSFAVNHLGPMLADYHERYSDVALDITLSDRTVDLVEEGFDLAIRISRIRDSALVARQFASARSIACAAPAYLKKHGMPRVPEDLARHACLSYTYHATRGEWHFQRGGKSHAVRVKGPVDANNGDLLREAAIAGMGIVLQPSFIVGDALRSKKLVPVLAGYDMAPLPIYAVYPSRRHLSAKVRTFVDYLVERFGNTPDWDRDMQA